MIPVIDYEYQESIDVVAKLDPSIKKDKLILKHIDFWKDQYRKSQKLNEEYQAIFNAIAGHLPNNNPTFI